jgi:hypothetical protein
MVIKFLLKNNGSGRQKAYMLQLQTTLSVIATTTRELKNKPVEMVLIYITIYLIWDKNKSISLYSFFILSTWSELEKGISLQKKKKHCTSNFYGIHDCKISYSSQFET